MKQQTWIFTAAALLTLVLGTYKYFGAVESQNEMPNASGSAQAGKLVAEKGAKLVIWADEDNLAFMNAATKSFISKFGSDVEFTVTAVSPMSGIDRLVQDGGTTRVADVLEIVHNALGPAVTAGVVLENLASAQRIASEFIPPAANAATYQDVVYGFPTQFATVVLFYNKDILPKAPETFEELIKFAPSFNDKARNKYTLLWSVQNYYFSRMFYSLFGAYEFGKNGTDPKDFGITSDAAVQGMTALLELKAANNARNADMTNPQVPRGLFNERKVAAMIEGPWATKTLTESGVNVGIVPIPTFKGRNPRTFSTVLLTVVSSYTQYPQAAQLFADYLSSKEMLKKRFEMTGSIPPMKSLMEQIASSEAPAATKAIIQQAAHSDAMPSIPEMAYLWSPMAGALVDMWDNGKPAKEVLTTAKEIIDEQLKMQEQEGKRPI
jgi:arabinogalactan oligomer/maltooligosaccharide transport system substrate-binding protein